MMGEAREGPVTATRASSTAWLALEKIEMMQQQIKVLGQQEFLLCKHSKTERDSQTVQNNFTGVLGDFNLIAFTRKCEYSKCELKL